MEYVVTAVVVLGVAYLVYTQYKARKADAPSEGSVGGGGSKDKGPKVQE